MPESLVVPSGDGIDLAVHDHGGDGPDLLLAHATGFHGLVWSPVVAHLTGRFRCVSFDERGHGRSGRPPDGDFSWHAFGRDALTVVDALGLDRPFAVGHSCGGALLVLAEQARPGSFRALWCYEPIVFPLAAPLPPDPGSPLAVGARRRRSAFMSRDEAYASYSSRRFFAQVDPVALHAYVDHGFVDGDDGQVHLRCRPEDEAATFAHGSSHDAWNRLGEVRCPVTVAAGATTDAIDPVAAAAIAERLPAGRVEVFDGLGHLGPLEDPRRAAAAIAAAFADTAAAGG